MANKMLIDASHPEETRVVVLRGNRVEEFDFESANKKQLRGNIYLAKVIRVEPSLQAAFVDYGGNRHGFLAFAEIHPDYYQIPVADRQALLEEEAQAQRNEDEEGERQPRRSRRNRRDAGRRRRDRDAKVTSPVDAASDDAVAAPTDADQPTPVVGDLAEVAIGEAPALEAPTPDAVAADAPEAPAVEAEAVPALLPAQPVEPVAEASGADAPVEEARAPALRDVDEKSGDDAADDDAAGDDAAGDDDADDDQPERAEPAVASDEDDDEEDDDDGDDEDDGDDDEDDDEDGDDDESVNGESAAPIEQVGGDAMEEVPHRPIRSRRQYKIQEVIRRRQILLVQVVKEERGNKGAALTTYLSLAGRYSVLMPNTARGGGISRKITDSEDRKRLKAIASELEVPDGMGVIVRTAGAARTRAEVKRDFEYLMRMWETVRETTLRSTAPCLVYEEGSLIKRAIRDLYSKEIDEILVAGEQGWREARDFMRLLMPSHARQVQLYTDAQPLFARSGVEQQLDGMFSNHVTLKSGGYIVINQTEALVAIDVNSGRSTREHNIEDTALRTNLEAADEVARQLRLRDLAGLVVVDFIDMEENRNNRAVERRMKDALKNDRARIQVGRISHFGLLEMSRQRIRTGVLEGSTVPCPHCMGAGSVRSTASIALHVLRVLEDTLMRSAAYDLTIRTRTAVALYVLNQKRAHLLDLEMRFGVTVTVVGDDGLTGSTYHVLERGEPASGVVRARPVATPVAEPADEIDDVIEDADDEEIGGASGQGAGLDEADGAEERDGERGEANGEDADGRKRRRRRRRRGRGERPSSGVSADAPQPSDDALAELAIIGGDLPAPTAANDGETSDDETTETGADEGARDGAPREGRSRRRRRGRGAWRPESTPAESQDWGALAPDEDATDAPRDAAPAPRDEADAQAAMPFFAAPPASIAEPVVVVATADAVVAASDPDGVAAPESMAPVSAAPVAAPAQPVEAQPVEAQPVEPPAVEPLPEAAVDPAAPKRTGWWARAKAGFGG